MLLGTFDFLPDVIPIFWLKIKNKKILWIQHIFHLIPFSRKIPFFAQRASFLIIKHLADLVIVDNSILKQELINLGFNPKKIFVNYPGINFEYLKTVRAKRKVYEGLFMGRLHFSKGIFDLPKIWKLVVKKIPNARLGIIGRGGEEIVEKLKREIKMTNLEKNIDILGYLPDKEAFETIKSSRVFIFPSYEEGFGIVGLEAQALGLPVVAWNLPVFEEIFPKGMVKLEKGKIKEFSQTVVDLLENEKMYQKISKEAIINAERFSWDQTAKRELELIKKLIK